MLRHPCILGDRQTKGDKIRIGCLTPTFSGLQKRAEMLHHPCFLGDPQTKEHKIRIGCLTLAFSGAQKRAKMLHHPCILGDPQTKGDKIIATTYNKRLQAWRRGWGSYFFWDGHSWVSGAHTFTLSIPHGPGLLCPLPWLCWPLHRVLLLHHCPILWPASHLCALR